MKVIHTPVNIGNQPWTLSRYERELGIKSDLIVCYPTWLQYPYDKCLGAFGDESRISKMKRYFMGLYAPLKYDVLHYYFGRTIYHWYDYGFSNKLTYADLKIAKKLGKKVFMTLQGCDIRLAEESEKRNVNTACNNDACDNYQGCINGLDLKRKELIRSILPLCDQVFFLNPELGHYIPKGCFLPYANVDVEKMPLAPPSMNKKPLILHAPSNPTIKGTKHIEAALDKLKKHYEFDYISIQKMTHEEAMKQYVAADLVIDQLLLGWYGGFAVEVMAMGKPVLCNIRDSDLHFIPKQMADELPLLRMDPENIVEQIKQALERRSEWGAIGQKSREYVLRWHNPRTIARAMQKAYSSPHSHFSLIPTEDVVCGS